MVEVDPLDGIDAVPPLPEVPVAPGPDPLLGPVSSSGSVVVGVVVVLAPTPVEGSATVSRVIDGSIGVMLLPRSLPVSATAPTAMSATAAAPDTATETRRIRATRTRRWNTGRAASTLGTGPAMLRSAAARSGSSKSSVMAATPRRAAHAAVRGPGAGGTSLPPR